MCKKLPILLALGVLAVSAALADDDDPPGRAARLGYVNGTVSLQPAGVDDWILAELNRPLTTGDRVWTQDDGRAELSLGSSVLRLNKRTNTSLINLDDHIAQVEISTGTLTVSVHDLGEGETLEVDTPNLAFSVLRAGRYRFDVSEQGDSTVVTVVSGEGEATTSGQAYPVLPGERVRVTADPAVYTKETAPPSDPFDDWCSQRDKREETSFSSEYVAADVPGQEDLDDHGIWRSVPEYGDMWMPTGVPDDWAPYKSGHWVWVAPWGWTWVDDMPWGYAPFHYGRWAFVGGGWGWIPGPFGGPAIFSPAMVAWIGGDGFMSGGELVVGWVPLGPGELFIPGFHASALYFARLNARNTIVNRVQVTNVYNNVYVNRNYNHVSYVNEHAHGGVTVVPHAVLTNGRPVMRNTVPVSRGTMAFREFQHTAPVAPQREAVLGGRAPTYARPPASVANRPIMTKATPPAARPSFQQQEAALHSHPGQPVDRATMASLRNPASEPTRNYRSATTKPSPAVRPAEAPRPAVATGSSTRPEQPRPSTTTTAARPPSSPASPARPAAGQVARPSTPAPAPRAATPAPAPRAATPAPAPRPTPAPAPRPAPAPAPRPAPAVAPRPAPAPAPAPRPAPAPAPRPAPAPAPRPYVPPPTFHH